MMRPFATVMGEFSTDLLATIAAVGFLLCGIGIGVHAPPWDLVAVVAGSVIGGGALGILSGRADR